MLKLTFLWTDVLIYLLVLALAIVVVRGVRKQHLRVAWRTILHNRFALVALMILATYVLIGLLDSIHIRASMISPETGETYYSTRVSSVLDTLLDPLGRQDEKTYSMPLATHLYTKLSWVDAQDETQYDYLRLNYGGAHLNNPEEASYDISLRVLKALLFSGLITVMFFSLAVMRKSYKAHQNFNQVLKEVVRGRTLFPWRTFWLTLFVLLSVFIICANLAPYYHILGTDKIGQDVFYQALKSIRTGLVIGTLSSLFMLPFAIVLGLVAGYFGKLVDDVIQYIYTVVSAIPGVLLIAAMILSLQLIILRNPDLFPSVASQADIRLLALCFVLGITGWVGLCRILRAETLKLREMDYVQAARALGTSNAKILRQHIAPNLMHLILIAVVLDFSSLVLAEAVLTYIGVGVDATTYSWGNMINSARLELAREPVVWWPLIAAFIFMFVLVLAANLLADAVRDAFDPRARKES